MGRPSGRRVASSHTKTILFDAVDSIISMRRPNLHQQEDAVTFGRRLRFIDLVHDDQVMPWPCLFFEHIQELLTVLGNRGMLECPHMLRRINLEYLQHLQSLRGRPQRPKHDPVVFLFGNKTPGGSRILFDDGATNHIMDYKDSITYAVDTMGTEPCFMDALNETSPILGDLLAAEMESPDRLPDAANGEHAPAA